MNCQDPMISKEEAISYADLQEKEAKIQLLHWVLQLLGTGQTIGMIRAQVHKKIDAIKTN
jgi:hypothetical protein